MGEIDSDAQSLRKELEDYRIAYEREREARKHAERLAEQYASDLFKANEALNIKALETRVSHAQSQLVISIIEYVQMHSELTDVLPKLMDNILKVTRWPVGFCDCFDPQEGERQEGTQAFINRVVRLEAAALVKRCRTPITRLIDRLMIESEQSEYVVGLEESGMVLADELRSKGLHYIVALPLRVNTQVHAIFYFVCPDGINDIQNTLIFLRTIVSLLGFLVESKLKTDLLNVNYTRLQHAHRSLKDTRTQLIHTERLASVGTLAAGVAHEINNPVCYVKTNLNSMRQSWRQIEEELRLANALASNVVREDWEVAKQNANLLEKLRNDHEQDLMLEDLHAMLEDCVDGTNRVIDIVRGLKQFARPSSPQKQRVDLNQCVSNALRLTANELKYKASVSTDLRPLPLLLLDQQGIEQVLVNFLVNAAQAIDAKGEIHVATSVENGTVECLVKDTGCGIAPELLPKIFDPFYTSKPVGVGTGLGLSISHSIVRNNAGDIEVESIPGEGTTFHIRFAIQQ